MKNEQFSLSDLQQLQKDLDRRLTQLEVAVIFIGVAVGGMGFYLILK